MRKIAISDIHGCKNTFDALLDQLALTHDDQLFLLGDYIDRGPDSKGVVDRIWALQQEGLDVHCLMGNHEQLIANACIDPKWMRTWIFNGGFRTMESFGAELPREIPDEYIDFFSNLPTYLEVDEYILVHAGLNFKEKEPLEDIQSLLWIRDWYRDIDYDWLQNRIILHGHTPVPKSITEEHFKRLDTGQVMDIDCGCVFSGREAGMGYLCAFDMTNRELFFQESLEVKEEKRTG